MLEKRTKLNLDTIDKVLTSFFMINDFTFKNKEQKEEYLKVFQELCNKKDISNEIFVRESERLKEWSDLIKRPSPIDMIEYLFSDYLYHKAIKEKEEKRIKEVIKFREEFLKNNPNYIFR